MPKITENQIKGLQVVINDSQSSGKEVRRAQAIILFDKEENIETIKAITSYQRRHTLI